jgi:hypothetical protein
MNKTAIAAAVLLGTGAALSTGTASAAVGDFTMYDGAGGFVGSFVTSDTRDFGAGTWALSSTSTFFGQLWTAHNGTVYDTPGTYTFDAGDNSGQPNSPGTRYVVNLAAGETLGHTLFDWGTTTNIDVINVWDANGDSIDPDGDGIPGVSMIDGAFIGFNANFSLTNGPQNVTGQSSVSVIPVPAAVWLFGSGLLGLVGVARRKAASKTV